MIELWNEVLLEPVLNGLLTLSNWFGGSFGLAIIAITIVVNIIILPLTLRQTKSTMAMQAMQPKIQEIQKKYAKDKQKLQEETLKIYKESGINPIGCALPLLIQMPIWIALYQSIIQALATTPENLFGLSERLYNWSVVQEAIPPENHFLGLDLAMPNFIMVILVMATMWLSQKMTTPASADPKQKQTQQMMQWMMPLMFGFIFLNFPSGLPLYIIVMNIFRMVVQRFVTGNWGGLATLIPAKLPTGFGGKDTKGWTPQENEKESKGWAPSDKTTKEIKSAAKKSNIVTEEGSGDGSSRSKRKNRRGGR